MLTDGPLVCAAALWALASASIEINTETNMIFRMASPELRSMQH
jgi:hypothetical protein